MPFEQDHLLSATAARPRPRPAARLQRFGRDDSGGIIIFSLFIFVAMLLFAGLAIDFMRYETARRQVQNTLDRALLAAASLKQTQDPKAVVEDYFYRADLSHLLAPVAVEETVTQSGVTSRRVTGGAGGLMDPIFLSLLPMDRMPVLAYAVAEEGITELEISMVLDVSGSMDDASSSGKTKIEELREAAKDFVYAMQCNPKGDRANAANETCTVEPNRVSISVVPYAEQVLVGETLLGQYNATSEHSYSSCVDFVDADYDTPELSPTSTLQRAGHFDPWSGRSTEPYFWACLRDDWREVRPFMDDHEEVIDVIDALGAHGGTSIDIGMKWGTALLDPGTQSVVTALTETAVPGAVPDGNGNTEKVVNPAFDGRPYKYGKSDGFKVVILMTDGENWEQHELMDGYRSGPSGVWHYRKGDGSAGDRVFSVYNPSRNQYRYHKSNGDRLNNSWHDEPYAGPSNHDGEAFEMSFPELWDTVTPAWYQRATGVNPEIQISRATKNDRLERICEAAKDEGIIVYSIGFEIAEGVGSETVMKNCASTIHHYFLSDGMNLAKDFETIASSITKLRLRK